MATRDIVGIAYSAGGLGPLRALIGGLPRSVPAPPGHHLVIHEDELLLTRGPKINRLRPSADTLFRSIARRHGARGVAVVLPGALDDGAAGAAAVAARGGTVIVQEPAHAEYASMPSSALKSVPDAVIVSTENLAEAVLDLVGKEIQDTLDPIPADLLWETDMTELGEEVPPDRPGPAGPHPSAARRASAP